MDGGYWAERVYKSPDLCLPPFQFNFIASSSCRPVAHSFAEAKKQLKCNRKAEGSAYHKWFPCSIAELHVGLCHKLLAKFPPCPHALVCKMKADNFFKYGAPLYQPKNTNRSHSHSQNQPQAHTGNIGHLTSSPLLTSDDLRHLTQQRSTGYSDRESIASVSSAGGRIKRRSR